MKKRYVPEKLVAVSRYKRYFRTLPEDVRGDVYARMALLLDEERRYCDAGNYQHIAQILTTIALYEVLQRHGRTEAEAYDVVSREMWKALTPERFQKMARLPIFLPVMKKMLPFGFRHGSGVGWRYVWHPDDPRDRFHFECHECVYWHIFGERDLMKLGAKIASTGNKK